MCSADFGENFRKNFSFFFIRHQQNNNGHVFKKGIEMTVYGINVTSRALAPDESKVPIISIDFPKVR
jgi:hypothetical protein